MLLNGDDYNVKKIIVVMLLMFTLSQAEASSLPEKYDLRTLNRITSVKNQGISGPCWAFAALAAMESNYLTQNLGKVPDLSEMQLAYYLYKDPTASKAFTSKHTSGTLALEGNATRASSFLMRLSGPTEERNLPYTTQISDSQRKALNKKEPEDYKRVMRLRDAYFLNGSNTLNDNIKKELIMKYGAIVVSYYSDPMAYHTKNKHYTYYNPSHGTKTNHDVVIAGWDDNFSRNNFKPKPSRDGAWLVKNSWGTMRGSEKGYVWISYAQHLKGGTAFIVEKGSQRLRCYSYDDLGFCNLVNYSWAANVFRIRERKEILKEVSIYTYENNMTYELYIYSTGENAPASPIKGELKASTKGKLDLAGYHTINLPERITLNSGEYFSVVLKLSGVSFPVETKRKDYSMNAVVHDRESYFSRDGRNWLDGKNLDSNACIKAFTETKN